MTLPRFHFEEDEDDATTPTTHFVLKLPESYAQRLAALKPPAQPTISRPTPAAWMIEPPQLAPQEQAAPMILERSKLVAAVASAFAFIIIVAVGVGANSAAASSTSDDGPVGISHHAPKTLEKHVRTADRQRGFAPEVSAVSIETLQRSRHRRH